MKNSLLQVSTFELMRLWAELNEAWHGINGFGGYTAEIYSYRFQPYSPMAHSSNETEIGNAGKRILYDKAANALVDLVEMFCYEYNCTAEIDTITPQRWKYEIDTDLREYDHRAHITISK